MADREVRVQVSATEIPQYRRLVDFVTEVSVHADAMEDTELQAIVRQARVDLLELTVDPEPPEAFDA